MAYVDREAYEADVKRFTDELTATGREGVDELLRFLGQTDLFKVPATPVRHNVFMGGYLHRALAVLDEMRRLVELHELVVDPASVTLVGLLHGAWRYDAFMPVERRRMVNGVWRTVRGFEFREDAFPLGEGEKSAFIVGRYVTLTADEVLAIRWAEATVTNQTPAERTQMWRAMERRPLVGVACTAVLAASALTDELSD